MALPSAIDIDGIGLSESGWQIVHAIKSHSAGDPFGFVDYRVDLALDD